MIRITSKTESLSIGANVRIINGGYGAYAANKQEGVVCEPPNDSATWPDYAGECKEDAVVFVKCQDRVYGLASGCEVELKDINVTQSESQEELWGDLLHTMGFFPAPKYLIEVKEKFIITRKP